MDDMHIPDMAMPPPKVGRNFETRYVILDRRWRNALRGCAGSTYELAITILFEEYRCRYTGDEIVLSSAVTGMPHGTRTRAANELAQLGLIRVTRSGNHALRVTIILKKEK
jgi:hypothetical protein